jgi:hypothetical protein
MSYKFKAEANLRGGIYTPSELHRLGRVLERRIASANSALAAMRQGESLHLQYRAGSPLWSLSGGRSVSANIAENLIEHAFVAPVDDALFADMPGQSWRFTND